MLKVSINNKKNIGQSLIEVVVAVGVIVLLATGIVAGTSSALKSHQNSRSRSLATKLVQEGIGMARSKKNESWYTFRNLGSTGTGTPYCVITDFNTSTPCGDGNYPLEKSSGLLLKLNFSRDMTFIWDDTDKTMTIQVSVKWPEGSSVRESKAETIFTKWK